MIKCVIVPDDRVDKLVEASNSHPEHIQTRSGVPSLEVPRKRYEDNNETEKVRGQRRRGERHIRARRSTRSSIMNRPEESSGNDGLARRARRGAGVFGRRWRSRARDSKSGRTLSGGDSNIAALGNSGAVHCFLRSSCPPHRNSKARRTRSPPVPPCTLRIRKAQIMRKTLKLALRTKSTTPNPSSTQQASPVRRLSSL